MILLPLALLAAPSAAAADELISTDSEPHATIRAALILKPEPTVLKSTPANPLKVTLTMSATATRVDGTPVSGEEVIFSVFGRQPDLIDFGSGQIVCTAVTDANGFATCGGSGTLGAVLSILAGHGWVTHQRGISDYGFTSVKAPVLLLGG